jgi:hypothetical protein
MWQDIDVVSEYTQESERMQEICTYLIEIQGKLEEKEFNQTSPYRITEVRAKPDATLFTIYADQSGLIGLVRHLHHHGFVLLSMQRKGYTDSRRK